MWEKGRRQLIFFQEKEGNERKEDCCRRRQRLCFSSSNPCLSVKQVHSLFSYRIADVCSSLHLPQFDMFSAPTPRFPQQNFRGKTRLGKSDNFGGWVAHLWVSRTTTKNSCSFVKVHSEHITASYFLEKKNLLCGKREGARFVFWKKLFCTFSSFILGNCSETSRIPFVN